jgi:anti-sigma-K factor RskA
VTDPHGQASLYVVGALSPAEAAEFEEHIGGCVHCASEIASGRGTTAELSLAVAASPPPSLRSAVLAAISETPQMSATEPSDIPRPRLVARAGPTSSHGAHAPFPSRHRSPSARLPALLAAAAVIAALGFGGWAWQDRQAAHRDAQQAAAQAARLTDLLSATDVQTVTGRGVDSGMTGTVVLSPSRRQAVLVASNLPELPDGKVYEAWTIRRQPVPAGTFTASAAKRLVALPPSALAAQSVAITVEPAGGSPKPTTEAVFAVNIPQSG